ncbi:hypothetical protein E8E14_003926 [Neopestalotiopsis sp. 37M]|nr:hypothetical protein E8E14_003926 [Neopestalotiopsis sp. 37M]
MSSASHPQHWENLYDSRVQTCYDRGNDYYEQDQRHSRPPYPAGDKRATEDPEELVDLIKKEFEDSELTPPGEAKARFFLPRNRLVEILTPERVLVVISNLSGSKQLCKEDQKTFADAVCHGDQSTKKSVKLLAALLCSDLEDKFYSLVQRGVSDMCLPPTTEGQGKLKSMLCQNCSAEHSYLHNSSHRRLRQFYTSAYALNAPYFKRLEQKGQESNPHAHYIFSNEDVLPVVGNNYSKNKTSGSSTTMAVGPSGDHEGGFSTVTQVVFHNDHFELGSQKGEKYETFAIKQLITTNPEDFKKEVAPLLRLNDDSNQNFVKLLATFEIRNENGPTKYYLIFPWADGTLWDFWQLHDGVASRNMLPPWMADQCYRLALALQSFHNERNNQLKESPSGTENDTELFGRHGDIKAENILWFARQQELVLNDFGLARLHTKFSRSIQDPKAMARTETYRAPEFDMPNGKISRSSDIFSLGCAFLEFVTWCMEGHHSASEEFVNQRMELDPENGFETDTFFRVEDRSGGKFAVIKSTVTEWIEELRKRPHCSNYINDFLELIESHMLEPEPKTRWECSQVVKRLEVISQTCRVDTSYWKEPKTCIHHPRSTEMAVVLAG